MKRLILSIVMMAVTVVAIHAARALSEPFTAVQPDGTQVVITLYGDEYASWITTNDGVLVVEKERAYYVAAIDAQGQLKATTTLAHQKAQRSAHEQQLCEQQNLRKEMFFAKAATAMQQHRRAEVVNAEYFPHMGSPKCLVILANFSDNAFSSDDPEKQFKQYFSGEKQENLGHNEQNNSVSVREYYNQSSLGKFTPDFHVVGPVTLPNTLEYYGKDASATSKDVNFTQFCKDAIEAVDEQVDFHDFDNNSDGKVELVCIIYAGYGQSVSGNPSETLWPKCGKRDLATQDGVSVTYFNCSPELFRLNKGDDINGIGLFCHEYSHGMGLPDHYVTNNSAIMDNQSPEFWDLMDYGEYANNGYNPVPYTAWEQSAMGWLALEELVESKTIFPLKPVLQGGKAYFFGNGANSEEKILIEGQVLSDKDNHKLGAYRGHGLLAWHIAYNSSTINMGDYPNNTPSQPRVCIVPADKLVINGYRFVGKSSDGQYHPTADKPYTQAEYVASLDGDPFPGAKEITTLCVEEPAFPNFKFYNGEATPKQTLTNITETPDGLISFDYNDGINPVKHMVESLTLDAETLDLKVGESKQMKATILPVSAVDKRVYWSSTVKEVAAVDKEGMVTAHKEGTALIIGRSLEHPALWKSCMITVTKESPSGIVNVKAHPDGQQQFFDLLGRRMTSPTRPGIYILNGKKITVR